MHLQAGRTERGDKGLTEPGCRQSPKQASPQQSEAEALLPSGPARVPGTDGQFSLSLLLAPKLPGLWPTW